jgi:hypothetical protein
VRHAGDVAFDVRNLVIAARRVIGCAEGANPADVVYAAELMTDQATALAAADGRSRFLGG